MTQSKPSSNFSFGSRQLRSLTARLTHIVLNLNLPNGALPTPKPGFDRELFLFSITEPLEKAQNISFFKLATVYKSI